MKRCAYWLTNVSGTICTLLGNHGAITSAFLNEQTQLCDASTMRPICRVRGAAGEAVGAAGAGAGATEMTRRKQG